MYVDGVHELHATPRNTISTKMSNKMTYKTPINTSKQYRKAMLDMLVLDSDRWAFVGRRWGGSQDDLMGY